jgi:hypothetical protein
MMMDNRPEIDCDTLRKLVSQFSLVEDCDFIKDGSLRIATPFNYPNGSQVDLFLGYSNGLFSQYVLSDYGLTANYLLDMHIKPWSTSKRRQLIQDICETLEVESDTGVFRVALGREIENLSSAIVRLAQACIRVSDLSFTQRLQNSATFQESVEEFIAGAELTYETEPVLIGALNNPVKVDFRVKGAKVLSLVQTLSAPNPTNAHPKSVEVFTRWFDLQSHNGQRHQFVTVFDTINSFKEYDLERLALVSTVVGFPEEREELQEILAA